MMEMDTWFTICINKKKKPLQFLHEDFALKAKNLLSPRKCLSCVFNDLHCNVFNLYILCSHAPSPVLLGVTSLPLQINFFHKPLKTKRERNLWSIAGSAGAALQRSAASLALNYIHSLASLKIQRSVNVNL